MKRKPHKYASVRYRPVKQRSRGRRRILLVALCVAVVVIAVVAWSYSTANNVSSLNKVLLTTTKGDILIQLYEDMPITTGNFKNLVQQGVYDGTIFHRVIDGFMIQGGDPTGTGTGDPSIPTIPDELPNRHLNLRGAVAMANQRGSGIPDSGSSQFFINLVDNGHLDNDHPVFGRVISGMSVVDEIGSVPTNEEDRPIQDVTIVEAKLVE